MTRNEERRIFRLVEHGDHAAVKTALDEGADAGLADRFGVGLVHRAAAGGDAEMLRLLLDRGAAADAASDVGNTPLMLAAANGHLAVVELLLARGADPDRENRWGYGAKAWADWTPAAAEVKAVLQAAGG